MLVCALFYNKAVIFNNISLWTYSYACISNYFLLFYI